MRFSGHESFHCRHFWLKKGYDFRQNRTTEDATVTLGVGKNMVSAISYWSQAFGMNDTEISDYLFHDEKGKDPFLEDIGTLWLLQYQLVKTNHASIYKYVFNEFRKTHLTGRFSVAQLKRSLEHYIDKNNENVAEKTLDTDLKVFLRNYIRTSKNKRDIEDDLASIFIDLNLVMETAEGEYQLQLLEREDIPVHIFLFCILDAFNVSEIEDRSISFGEIQKEVADAFACNKEGVEKQIEKIQALFPEYLVYKEDAGRKELQVKEGMQSKWEVLNEYYG